VTPCAGRGVDNPGDLAIGHRPVPDDIQGLVAPAAEDLAKRLFGRRELHRATVDEQLMVGAVVRDDFRAGLNRWTGLHVLRDVDVQALLGQRKRGEENDQQHEQHVDQRCDVHVRLGFERHGYL
jgi:hypothetical protein